jgi:hypothetical protein
MWIVPADRVPSEAFVVKVVPLEHAPAGELAYTISWVAPPSVRVVPYYPTNSLIISGHPAAVDMLVGIIKHGWHGRTPGDAGHERPDGGFDHWERPSRVPP